MSGVTLTAFSAAVTRARRKTAEPIPRPANTLRRWRRVGASLSMVGSPINRTRMGSLRPIRVLLTEPPRAERRLPIAHAHGNLRQLLVRAFLFIERLLQQLRGLLVPELFGPGTHTAIAGDLVVLDLLRTGDHARVAHR